jgi:hypothetical protein
MYKELLDLRAKYTALVDKKPDTSVSERSYADGAVGSSIDKCLSQHMRESLRALDKGTSFLRPEKRHAGFGGFAHSAWSHPDIGERRTIPAATSTHTRDMLRLDTGMAPALSTSDFSASKQCEHSIMSGLMRLGNPREALQTLVRRIADCGDFVTVTQLQSACMAASLLLPRNEIELFAVGEVCFHCAITLLILC